MSYASRNTPNNWMSKKVIQHSTSMIATTNLFATTSPNKIMNVKKPVNSDGKIYARVGRTKVGDDHAIKG